MTSLNGLDYLRKVRLQQELDELVITNLRLTEGEEGNKCKVCDITQGQPLKGFEKYYCQHVTDRIGRKLKKEKEEVTLKILDLASQEF